MENTDKTSDGESQPKAKREAREIILTHRNETVSHKSTVDHLEQWSKIAAALAIPIVIAIAGWFFQHKAADNSVNQECVKLAVTILMEKPDSDQEPLRKWAVQLLNQHSEIKFTESVQRGLASGQIVFPQYMGNQPAFNQPGPELWCLLGYMNGQSWTTNYVQMQGHYPAIIGAFGTVTDILNVRVAPSFAAPIMGRLVPGDVLRIQKFVNANGAVWANIMILHSQMPFPSFPTNQTTLPQGNASSP